jgi:hypothetical protein
MGWSNGETYAAARRLERAEMVHIEKAERNGSYMPIIKLRLGKSTTPLSAS